MQLKIIYKEDNPLLSRIEVKAELTFKGATTSGDKVKEEIGKQLSSDVNLVFVKKIATNFGHQTAKVEAYVYKDEKVMNSIIKKGKKALEKEKKAAEDASKKSEESKADSEKKEEPKVEEKKEKEKPAEDKKE